LERYESVVLCLANFYPIHVSGEPSRGFETARNSLTESEAHLESLLLQQYDVDIVTVAITVADDYCTVVAACVLDYLPMLPDSAEIATTNDALDESQITLRAKCKIVAPMFGFGRKFSYHENCSWADRKGTLLTAMMITKLA